MARHSTPHLTLSRPSQGFWFHHLSNPIRILREGCKRLVSPFKLQSLSNPRRPHLQGLVLRGAVRGILMTHIRRNVTLGSTQVTPTWLSYFKHLHRLPRREESTHRQNGQTINPFQVSTHLYGDYGIIPNGTEEKRSPLLIRHRKRIPSLRSSP